MNNFSKNNEPKIIPNLGSNNANFQNNNNLDNQKKQNIQSSVNFEKHDSASFNETQIMYQNNISPILNVNKDGNNISMPKEEYTKEEIKRPIMDNRLNLTNNEKQNLSFTKGIVNDSDNKLNPLNLDKENIEEIPMLKGNKKRSYKIYIILILLEIIILGIVLYYRSLKLKTTLECTSENYNDYYHATIVNTKKYYFTKGNITKLEDIFVYTFDSEEYYNEFKEVSANPIKEEVKGRTFTSNTDDNNNSYQEKTIYDFKKLRSQNESDTNHNILVTTNENDTIELLDYNSTDIKLIYESDYICK